MPTLRADGRFSTEQPGIDSWHVFSAGPHYDATRLSHGPVIGCDEHLLEAGAGFDWHAHRGVVIVSWVLSGALRHEDADGAVLEIGGGESLVQATGGGIRHRETNGSGELLRFVQFTLLLDVPRRVERVVPPVRIGEVAIMVEASAAPPGEALLDERAFAFNGPEHCLTITW